ncbi:hypothetical protein PQX77_022103 [Marasmius sp. AFHP31]|nr:hypothetical protein PQX77_022103 [Marasmius sp. AFHP31]
MDITEAGAYYMMGTSLAINANRISYVFDMTGPSLPVDTACSSSLTAMHLAVQAVRNGECDQAVVAGVNIVVNPLESSSFSHLGVLSPDGISKSFDEDANGYTRGDVVGALVIKRHDLAVRDHDRILATLVGTALTSCGSIMGSMTTPSPDAQIQAIKNAYADAGLKPSQADFVELHGTGTIVGDQVEANAAGACFSEDREGREIIIGSVKSNVGHGEMGAYISSVVKIVMMLARKRILPNGYFEKPSSKINFAKYNLRVPVEVEDFVARDSNQGLIASISSFGFGGSCGHTVLREHEPRAVLKDHQTLSSGPFLFAVGGLTPRGVNSLIESYKAGYQDVDPASLSEHLGSRARQTSWRSFAVAETFGEAKFTDPVMVPKRAVPLIFCFSGQGPQHWQQGRDLFVKYAVFRDSILASDKIHTEYTGHSFLESTGLFLPGPPKESTLAKSLLWPADAISVGIAFFQIALFDLLLYLGLKPDAIVGHSIGETAVLYASGAMPREMVIKIAVARGNALRLVDNNGGAMVAISGCDSRVVQDYMDAVISLSDNPNAGVTDSLHIAACNSPTDFGVSGAEYLVDALTDYIHKWVPGISARKLRVGTAVHSPYVDLCEGHYRQDLYRIFSAHSGPYKPTIPVISTVTAEFVDYEYSVDYLWSNLRQPVRFSTAIPKLLEKYSEESAFLEIAPHPVLSQYIKQMGALQSVAGSKRPPSSRHIKPGTRAPNELDTLYDSISQLLACGLNSVSFILRTSLPNLTLDHKVNFALLNGCPPEHIQGPKYPFQTQYFPIGPRTPSHIKKLLPAERPLNSERLRVSPSLPEDWMAHHVIDQSNLIPAAVYIEMALEFPDVTSVWDCRFEAAFILDGSVPAATLKVARDGQNWSVRSSSSLQSMQGDLTWTRSEPEFDNLHAHGKLGFGSPEISTGGFTHVDVDAVIARCTTTVEHDAVYEELEGVAQFGSEFRRIQKISVNESEAIVTIKGHGETLTRTGYIFHPALMDAVFQSGISWNLLYDHVNVGNAERTFMLPHSLRRGFRNNGSSGALVFSDEFRVYALLAEWSPSSWTLDCYVLDDHDDVVFTFEGLRFELVQQDHPKITERFSMIWQPRAIPQSDIGGVVVLEDDPAAQTEELFEVLDKLALGYTMDALNRLSESFNPTLPDRKRYLDWAIERTSELSPASVVRIEDVSQALKERYAPLFELTQRVGEGQVDIFADSKAAVDILFRDDLMGRIYEHPPFIGTVFDETVKEFIKLVESAQKAGKRVIRVLEVGAGTGRFTAPLGQALLDANLESCYVEYVCSDISISLAQEATAKSPWTTIAPVAFDLNKPLEQQNVDPASFDIVVAFDVLHATPSVDDTLSVLRELLLPGGHLVVIELDGHSFASGAIGTTWTDYIFGSFQEWFGVLEHRTDSHCSLGRLDWNRSLRDAGFSDGLFFTVNVPTISHLSFVTQSEETELKRSGSSVPSLQSDAGSSPISHPQPLVTPSVEPPSFLPMEGEALLKYNAEEQLLPPTLPTFEDIHRIPPSTNNHLPPGIIIRHFSAGGEVELVKFVSTLDPSTPLRIWLHSTTETVNAGLSGLGRSLRHEFELWKIYIVLFHPSWSSLAQHDHIQTHLVPLRWVDSEVIVDAEGTMRVPRVVSVPSALETELAGEQTLHFNDTEFWRAFPDPLNPEDVRVSVSFITLSGVIPDHSEFSGHVVEVGKDVERSLVGKRVMGVTSSPKGNFIVCSRGCVSAVPDTMSLSFAAALAGRLAFTSSVVMDVLARVKPRSRVLLHASECSPAALATYAYLQDRDFDTFVTVSDPSSLSIPHKHPLSSGNVQLWSQAVRKWSPEGVDFIFNFEDDPSILDESVERLARRGTLIQVGQRCPSRIRPGQQLRSVGFDRLFSGEDNILEDALKVTSRQVMTRIAPSTLVFQADALKLAHEKATKYKDVSILLDFETLPENLTVHKPGRLRGTQVFDPRASYVIVGGIGGLGVSLARCLVDGGARHIVLTSRSGNKAFVNGKLAKEKKVIKALRQQSGVTIDLVAVDCLDEKKTKALFSGLPNVAGVFYVAVRLNDSLFLNLNTEEDWKKVHDVKVKGVRILLEAIDPKKLDFLVLTSSMATVSGSPGQVNYSAAQTEMEAMGANIPNCVSVAVPPLTDGGVFVRSMPTGNARSAALEKYKDLGMTSVKLAQHCVDAIWTIGTERYSPVYIPATNWKRVLDIAVPEYCRGVMRHLLVKETATRAATDGKDEQTLLGACANVLSLDLERVEDNIPLSAYGLDSLTSVRLSGVLKSQFGIDVTQLQLLSQTMTVERLFQLQEEQKIATSETTISNTTPDEERTSNVHEADLGQTIVRLNSATEGTPLFVVHGAGGGVVVLVKAAQKAQYPVYGVQDTPDAPLSGTLRQLSEFYLEKIRAKQPHGPYRLGGFSFGSFLAVDIAEILRDEGEIVEALVLLDGSPTLFTRPAFYDNISGRIRNGKIQEDIIEIVEDMASSGALDDSDAFGWVMQFADHIERIKEGGSGPKWIARFYTAYICHCVMGCRKGRTILDDPSRGGKYMTGAWPAQRTVLVRALNGISSRPHATGATECFDLDLYDHNVEKYDLPGTHFGILAPQSGLDGILESLF